MAAEPYAVRAPLVTTALLGRLGALALPVGAGALVVGVAAPNGSYFPTTWGWCTLALLGVTGLMLARGFTLAPLDRWFVAGIACFTGFVALSLLWTETVPGTVREVQRSLLYVAAAFALVAAARRGTVQRLLAGVLAGVTAVCAYALATRLFPDRIGGTPDELAANRLAEPLGYWNAVGLLAVLGLLLAFGFSARAAAPAARAAAAATLPALAATAYFTFSRGAWVALAVGLAALVACEPRRLRSVAALAVLLPAPAGAVATAARVDSLTHSGAAFEVSARDAELVCVTLAVLAVASAIVAIALRHAQTRVHVRAQTRRTLGAALIVATLVAVVTAAAVVAPKVASGFTAKPEQPENLNDRVLNTSGNGRAELWRIAWGDVTAHPLLGSGAGSYEQVFYRQRDTAALNVRDAHGLYLETLAEVGPLGLVLLLVVLAVPLAAAVRARRSPLVPAAAGAYTAFLVHAAWDWDWELPGVTIVGLAAGAALLAAAGAQQARVLSGRTRVALGALLVVPGLFAAVTLAGERANARGVQALEHAAWPQAAAHARRARTLLPWSGEPWQTLARARLANGDLAGSAAAFRAAIRRDPHNATLWLDLAIVSKGTARIDALEHARRLNPLNPELSTS